MLRISPQYQYVKIDDYYFCLQQSPFVLAWILFFKRNDLITLKPWLRKTFPRWSIINFRYQWKIIKYNVVTLNFFIQCRNKLQIIDTVYLPVFGQFGMSVHKGFKIFNIYSGSVTKIFDPDVNVLSIISEIDHLKNISQISFAPSLKRWDSNERWYEEDYVRGTVASKHRATDSGTLLKAFYKEAAPCIKRLISFQPPLTKELQKYVDELNGILDISRGPEWNSYHKEVDTFIKFVNVTVNRLRVEGNQPITLVFTHGDFCPANILSTKDGIKVVDWENAGYRSLMFDFYSYFFYRPVNVNNISVEKMSAELHKSLPGFMSGTGLKLTISDGVYRRLYYLEYLCKLVERLCSDKRLNIMDFIMRYIDAFTLFDENYNNGTRVGQMKSKIFPDALKNSL